MTVVNDVGVDPNRLLEHPHTVALLQFVCGLGPRKASFLLKVRPFFMKMTHFYRTWKSANDKYPWFDDYDCPVSRRTVTGEFRLHARTSCSQMIRFPYQALASLHLWLRRKILRMLVSSVVLPALQKITLCVLWVRLSRMWRRSGTRILLLNFFYGWCHLSSNKAWMLTLFRITESRLFESIEISWMTDDWLPTSEKFKHFCIKCYKTCFQAITLTSIGIFSSCD